MHQIKFIPWMPEVETDANRMVTATVTRELSERINEGAAPGDVLSDGALRQRVLNTEGAICRKPTDNPEPKKQKRPDQYFNPASIMSDDFSRAFDAFIEEVKEAWEILDSILGPSLKIFSAGNYFKKFSPLCPKIRHHLSGNF